MTPPGVMSAPNSGMTIHTLVLTVGSFSCNCNSIDSSMSKGLQEHFSLSSSFCCVCINTSVFSNVNQFQLVQQCIQISTRINSSMYICTCVFVSFETYPIFNKTTYVFPWSGSNSLHIIENLYGFLTCWLSSIKTVSKH